MADQLVADVFAMTTDFFNDNSWQYLKDLEELFKLFERPQTLDRSWLWQVLDDSNVVVVVACDIMGTILGMATVSAFNTLTGRRAKLEHVAALPLYQGSDMAQWIYEEAVMVARDQLKATRLEWTSAPTKERANGFYAKQGLTPRETNVYRLDL